MYIWYKIKIWEYFHVSFLERWKCDLTNYWRILESKTNCFYHYEHNINCKLSFPSRPSISLRVIMESSIREHREIKLALTIILLWLDTKENQHDLTITANGCAPSLEVRNYSSKPHLFCRSNNGACKGNLQSWSLLTAVHLHLNALFYFRLENHWFY